MKKSDREKYLEAQVRHLADIVSLAVGSLIQLESMSDDLFERELVDHYQEQQGFLLDMAPHFTALREQVRGTVHYERAQIRLREHMTDWIRERRKRDGKD